MLESSLAELFEVACSQPRRKPAAAEGVDRSHPLADGLDLAVLFAGALPPRDLATRSRSVVPVNQRLANGIEGTAAEATASTGRFELSPIVAFTGPEWALSCLVRFPIANNSSAVLACNNSPYAFHVLRNAASNVLASWQSGSYSNFSPTVAPLSLTGWRRLTVVGTAGGVGLHLDGQLVASHATPISTGVRYILGDGDGGSLTRAFGAGADFFVWTRSLSDAEVRTHALAPYAMLRPGMPGLFRSAPAGTGLFPPFPRAEPNTLLRM